MYRKYRIGDLPDIQIKYSYVIAPLQALAQVRYVNLSNHVTCTWPAYSPVSIMCMHINHSILAFLVVVILSLRHYFVVVTSF